MGYTHYFTKKKDVPAQQWQELCDKVSILADNLPRKDLRIHSYNNRIIKIYDYLGEQPVLSSKSLFVCASGTRFIEFNGDASKGMDHESFVLRQTGKQGYMESFCKTARKPYDWLVTAVLILVHHHCPGCYDINSDGGVEEWEPVLRWLNDVLQTSQYELPPKIA